MMKLTKTKLKRHHSSPAGGGRLHHGNNQSHNTSLLTNIMNHNSSNEKEEEENGSPSPSPSPHVGNNNNNNDNDDIECNPIHNNNKNITSSSPLFHILLRKRLSRNNKSHGSNHCSLVLSPLEPPITTKSSVGRTIISEPTITHDVVVSTSPAVEQQRNTIAEQLHMDAKTKVETSLSSINKLKQVTKYIQTLPTYTLNEIKTFVANESTTTKGNYTNMIIDKFVLNYSENSNNNKVDDNNKQREEFMKKQEEKEVGRDETIPTITANNKPRYSLKKVSSSTSTSSTSAAAATIKELYNEIYILSLLSSDDDDDDDDEEELKNNKHNMIHLKGLINVVVATRQEDKSNSDSNVNKIKLITDEEQGSTPIYYYNGLIINTVIQETLDETLNHNGGRWYVRNKQLHHQHYNLKNVLHHRPHNHLHDEKKKFFNERLQYCIDIISAIQYIHSKHVVHSNIQPCNIGFDIQGNIKLINFEHAHYCVTTTETDAEENENKEKQTATSVINDTNANDDSITSNHHHKKTVEHITMSCETLKYIAPELLLLTVNNNNNNTVTTAVDIYSMGYIVWQMIGLKHKLYDNFSKEQVLTYVHQKGCRPMFDYSQQHCWTKNIVALLKSMWSDVPNERPTSQHAYDVLVKEL